jgi:DNA-binding NarL/FixJ family response regulator
MEKLKVNLAYMIEHDGSVYNAKGIERKSSIDKKGYHHITLSNNGQRTTYLVHRLVAQQYLPNPFNLTQVNHIDGNKSNNNLSNLEWVNGSTNILHSFGLKLSSYKGDKNGRAKLTEAEVIQIKQLLLQGVKNKEIADKFGISKSVICDIKHKRKWSHIDL